MTLDDLFRFLFSVDIWGIAKFFISFTLVIYIVFAFVVVKQVNLMTETIDQYKFPLRALAHTHFIAAILIFLFALVIL